MNQVGSLIYAHRGVIVFVAGLTTSKAVGALPEPKPDASAFYLWFHAFATSMVSAIKPSKPPV